MNPDILSLMQVCQQFYSYHDERGNTPRALRWLCQYRHLLAMYAAEIDSACEAVWNE